MFRSRTNSRPRILNGDGDFKLRSPFQSPSQMRIRLLSRLLFRLRSEQGLGRWDTLVFIGLCASVFVFNRWMHRPNSPIANAIGIETSANVRPPKLSIAAAPTGVAPLAALASAAEPELPSAESEDVKKIAIVDEILKAGNDNDPRLDSELKVLSPSLRDQLFHQYNELPTESRNRRGLIVFLIGRNLKRTEDFGFLRSVLSESKCLSLSSCTRSETGPSDDGSPTETLMNYPQVVALSALSRLGPAKSLSREMQGEVAATIQQALHSPIALIRERAKAMANL